MKRTIDITKVSLAWQPCGLIVLCGKGWPKFPPMPEVAGLYCITLNDGRIYIGEAQSIKRRLYEYRRPTPGIEQEHRVHAALVAARGGKVDIYTAGDLSTRPKRMKLEKAEIEKAMSEGLKLINDGSEDDAGVIRLKIKFYEGEIKKLRQRLASIKGKA